MTKQNDSAADAAKTEAVDEAPEFTVTLDRSRAHASVHGSPEIAGLGYFQDGIPFDVAGNLHQVALNRPEYKDAKEKVRRIVKRMQEEHVAASKVPDLNAPNIEPPVKPEDPDAHIDLVKWAKGELKVMPHKLYGVAQRRSGKQFKDPAEIKAWLVEIKALAASEVK